MTKTEAKQYLTVGNHKLADTIATFDLPAAQHVCGRVCDGCYALKAQNMYKHVLPSRERKLEFTKSAEFVPKILQAVRTLNPKFVRIHSSGEFYSQKYIDDWVAIVKACPTWTFYAYTKRLNGFNFAEVKKQKNFVLINSLHSGKLNYGKAEAKPADMFLCPDVGGKMCGESCTYCMTKEAEETGVYFVKH